MTAPRYIAGVRGRPAVEASKPSDPAPAVNRYRSRYKKGRASVTPTGPLTPEGYALPFDRLPGAEPR